MRVFATRQADSRPYTTARGNGQMVHHLDHSSRAWCRSEIRALPVRQHRSSHRGTARHTARHDVAGDPHLIGCLLGSFAEYLYSHCPLATSALMPSMLMPARCRCRYAPRQSLRAMQPKSCTQLRCSKDPAERGNHQGGSRAERRP